jgi:hypothetical protein
MRWLVVCPSDNYQHESGCSHTGDRTAVTVANDKRAAANAVSPAIHVSKPKKWTSRAAFAPYH